MISEHSNASLLGYLREALSLEDSFASQLDQLAATAGRGDDGEIQSTFTQYAFQSRSQRDRVLSRITETENSHSEGHAGLGAIDQVVPQLAHSDSIVEEQILQSLISAYSVSAAKRAAYETIARIADAKGDMGTASLARDIQEAEVQRADQVWHFLNSRSKIALNMLTLSEVDPSVETKLGDNRLIES